jgi:hypothetical protein
MFDSFPKTRSALPVEYKRIYAEHFKQNREGGSAASGLSKLMESWMHRKVAEDAPSNDSKSCPTLEIGAGTLNHLSKEPFTSPYDIVEPYEDLYRYSPELPKIHEIFADISVISRHHSYKRIISIATFEHVLNLPEVVSKCGLLLTPSGTLRVAIPSEGTVLWKLAWKVSTGLEFRLRHSLDYGVLMQHEHVNTAKEIAEVLSYFFSKISISCFGLGPKYSLYQYYECSEPSIDRCEHYLGAQG